MPPLCVVALISGGKDSLFSILHCLANGHKVIALGNLHPPEPGVHDLDSFMYQTVGHNLIGLIAQALELPLYRQAIVGSAVTTSKTYDHAPESAVRTDTDEVESMLTLLRRVREAHPEINAVSTGAILSDYQRTRVESVALRLGLTPLSYLWQFPFLPPYDEAALLRDMAEVAQDSRIIKVASGALDETFLWKNVADTRTIMRLQKAAERFGSQGDGSTIGEGGEYETLTVDGPAPLWKHSIVVDDADQQITSGEAGTAALEIVKASLHQKHASAHLASQVTVRKPPLLDDAFSLLRQETRDRVSRLDIRDTRSKTQTKPHLTACVRKCGQFVRLDNFTARGDTVAEQTQDILNDLTAKTKAMAWTCNHVTILLRNMDDFQAVNAIYGEFFGRPNPPSRVTVACGELLPDGVLIVLSFTGSAGMQPNQRHGLHVQSLSYWAPANIGPYSQAISVPVRFDSSGAGSVQHRLVHVAGQIPLVPSSMQLLAPEASDQKPAWNDCILSLQHLWRIGTSVNIHAWLGGMALFGRSANEIPHEVYVQACSEAWACIHGSNASAHDEDDEEDSKPFDIWDKRYGQQQHDSVSQPRSTYRSTIRKGMTPPIFAAEVTTLPRNAAVEWSATGYTGTDFTTFRLETTTGSGGSTHYQLFSFENGKDTEVAGWLTVPSVAKIAGVPESLKNASLCTAYCTEALPELLANTLGPQIIPCFRVWDVSANSVLEAVLFYVVENKI